MEGESLGVEAPRVGADVSILTLRKHFPSRNAMITGGWNIATKSISTSLKTPYERHRLRFAFDHATSGSDGDGY